MTRVYSSVHIEFAPILSHQGSPKNSTEGATPPGGKETEVNSSEAGRSEQLQAGSAQFKKPHSTLVHKLNPSDAQNAE
ncbi:hypothetical protein QLX08_005758 [Tetragonisca angustula]|uniref:Uncharacterized protein n=1 Tax=Tetragonisca angustula TaxID=166442 RepID=A0AAW0ZWU8_9HYME